MCLQLGDIEELQEPRMVVATPSRPILLQGHTAKLKRANSLQPRAKLDRGVEIRCQTELTLKEHLFEVTNAFWLGQPQLMSNDANRPVIPDALIARVTAMTAVVGDPVVDSKL